MSQHNLAELLEFAALEEEFAADDNAPAPPSTDPTLNGAPAAPADYNSNHDSGRSTPTSQSSTAAAESLATASRVLLERALALEESQTSSKAECIAAYIAAADAHLSAIELAQDEGHRALLKTRTSQILDRVADLKAADAQVSAHARLPPAPPERAAAS